MFEFDVPKRYASAEATALFNGCDPRLRRFAGMYSGGSGALLIGPTGCGKSLAAASALLLVTLDQPRDWACWVRSDELSRLHADRCNADAIAYLKRSLVLVVDDLGYERFSEFVVEIICSRHDNNLPTIVTSGLGLTALSDRYSIAVLRKITEIGDGSVVDCWENAPAQQEPYVQGKLPAVILSAQRWKKTGMLPIIVDLP